MNGKRTVGIVGGGQLGRMLTLAALPLGFDVVVINPSANSPAAQVGAKEIVADLYDKNALAELAALSDYITVEIEHLDTTKLQELVDAGLQINPLPKTIKLIQDKYLQKKFLDENNIAIAPFCMIDSKESAQKALKKFGGKMLLKTRHGAYDGRGNMVVSSSKDIEDALEKFGDSKLYAEKFIPFKKELAVVVAKSVSGDISAYPVVETVHERNICLEVLSPADVDEAIQSKAEKIALHVAQELEGAGVYGIELFLTKDDEILVNEIAPRVHNSGHHTIEGNKTSQFEQHIRAVTGLPLGDSSLVAPATVMINILGDRNGETILEGLAEALSTPQTSVHLYGKSPTKIDRKMGHITTTGKSLDEARKRARLARKHLRV